MKLHTTNYINTFIKVAEDSSATKGEIPPLQNEPKSIARLQYKIISGQPYKFTSDEILFKIFAQRNNLQKSELQAARKSFFSKGQPCFRSSPLTKKYGWGLHNNNEGKVAMYGAETNEYKKFLDNKTLKIVAAMRSKKA